MGPQEEQEDSGITMLDVLQEEEELEDDAEAVLGMGDDNHCTYDKGYMKRQPLYACFSCLPKGEKISGGVCLACSYHCHEGHELVELYTKRLFRCDCGNSRLTDSCKLVQEKDSHNEINQYNQNFEGKYCTCGRPYPDPDDSTEDQMIQCCICEDWFHGRHLEGADIPGEDSYAEMICHMCTSKLQFLQHYAGFAVSVAKVEEKCGTPVEVAVKEKGTNEICKNEVVTKVESVTPSSQENSLPNETKSDSQCKLKVFIKLESPVKRTLFFPDGWRQHLCICESCKAMYESIGVSFLCDPEDTVSHYEKEGRRRQLANRGVERELEALASLDRITRTEVVHEYNNLSASLREYLKKFAENGKIVRGEDIQEFFARLTANKKQRTIGIPHFCK